MTGESGGPGRCPVCAARFRESAECSRCGADLTPLMALIARAHALRREARTGLARGQACLSQRLAAAAEDRQATPAGSGLKLLAEWVVQRALDGGGVA